MANQSTKRRGGRPRSRKKASPMRKYLMGNARHFPTPDRFGGANGGNWQKIRIPGDTPFHFGS